MNELKSKVPNVEDGTNNAITEKDISKANQWSIFTQYMYEHGSNIAQ